MQVVLISSNFAQKKNKFVFCFHDFTNNTFQINEIDSKMIAINWRLFISIKQKTSQWIITNTLLHKKKKKKRKAN